MHKDYVMKGQRVGNFSKLDWGRKKKREKGRGEKKKEKHGALV